MSEVEQTGKTAASGRRLTVKQAAEEWQLHPDTIRAAIRAGKLPAVWAGSGYRIFADDVEAWVRREWGREQ